ncbi:MAG: hypothetical protein JXX29_11915 [Deltaproteobacteria bacterium]|nr:hypothetical protein [Deltaproteobacteria bacterium]MBN2672380.1 hypothetical protein [Deltaproteobacteria bacterium]
MIVKKEQSEKLFNPRSLIKVVELPEGTRSLNVIARIVLSRGEWAYDPLWRYVRSVDSSVYRGQGAAVRIGDYFMGMRGPNRIPAFADFRKEILYVGRKLVIPFNSIRGVMAGHGMLPWRKVPVFVLMVKVDGSDAYIPIHQCLVDLTVVDLADFLSSHMHAPLGIASNPLQFLIQPGSATMLHSNGQTPLYEIRGIITSRGPDGRTRIKVMCAGKTITIIDKSDPMGWIENWGIVADDLISIVARRTKSKYGHEDFV